MVSGHVDQVIADTVRTTVVGLLNNPKLPPPNMTPVELKALRFLQRDTSIVPADKGRSTVVLDRSSYDQKIWDLLSDKHTHKVVPKNPAPVLERRMNDLLRSLKRSGAISSQLYSRLYSSAGKTPLLYGLPKVHKPGIPLRPIASFIHSPTYQLSKHLVSMLTP